MASSTPGSAPPSLGRAPIVAALQGSQRPLPHLPASPGPYARAWRRLRADPVAMATLIYLAALVVAVMAVPMLLAIDPFKHSLRDSLLAPLSPGHLLGTDQFGRDVLLRLVDGGRASLAVGFGAVAIATSLGSLVGLVAGMRGDWVDRVLMRLVDVELAFPGILLALIIVTILGPGLEKIAIAVGIGGMPRFARIVRGSVLSTKHELFIEAARSVGASDARVALVHVLPQVLGPVITIATFGLATAIFSIAGSCSRQTCSATRCATRSIRDSSARPTDPEAAR
ncbi:MAG: ABC transporter permease [Chloroflexi bacterium]|nr:MAG: ABC transporter permease [Chloroflexota bacterium]